MKTQNYNNHSQYVPVYHFIVLPICLICIGFAAMNLSNGINKPSLVLLLLSIAVTVGFVYLRYFALVAQDRAIRAEENLRHFTMTGKLLDKGLRINQITALRFADDREFIELAENASKNNMSSKEIKMAVKNWRADHNRA
ncbi:hypothetical protein BH10BAC5_BH10BAC5_12800 [soil metagenome]